MPETVAGSPGGVNWPRVEDGCGPGRAGTPRGVLLPRKLLFLGYLVVGVVVAASKDYLDNLDTARRLASAVIAILLWPLLLVGIDLHIR